MLNSLKYLFRESRAILPKFIYASPQELNISCSIVLVTLLYMKTYFFHLPFLSILLPQLPSFCLNEKHKCTLYMHSVYNCYDV